MANLVISIATIAVLMTGALTFTVAWIAGAGSSADAFEAAAELRLEADRSSLRHLPGCVIPLGSTIRATVDNNGHNSLRAFDEWDVIAHFQADGAVDVVSLAYSETAPPPPGSWALEDLRLPNGRPEAFGSGDLDPGERATIKAELPAGALAAALNKLTVATRNGAVAEIPFDGSTTCGYYLHNNPSPPAGDTASQANLPADITFPGASTLFNYDTDRDAVAGRLIAAGGSGPAESDLAMYQNWRTAALTQPLELAGTARVDFWAAVKGFNTVLRGDVTVHLRDYDGAGYTEIGSATVSANPWDAGATGTWVKATAAITGLDYTVPIGNRLEVKITVPAGSGDDMLLAYDTTAYPASVTIADVVDLVFSADQQRTGDLLSYLANTGPHDDGFYLHNNPTPPTSGTASQANLPASTSYPAASELFNYDTDRDAQPGLVIVQGGSGPGEADLAQYQNWLTPVLTEPLAISGPASLNIWSAVKDFNTTLAGELKFFLRDYDGAAYTEIAEATLSAGPWDAAATGTWVNRLLELPAVDYTLAAGHQLELKVIVGAGSGGDMWLAYDTSGYDSVLRLPGQRDRDRAGRQLTATVDAAGVTGRFSLDQNGGRFVFPLDGYTRVTDATWTASYRVKQPGYGFVWLANGQVITPGTPASWQVVDLSPYVPAGTTGAIVEVINTLPVPNLAAMVRGGDDTRDYVPGGTGQTINGKVHRWQTVAVNSDREIQIYAGSVLDLVFRLAGYTVGTDPVYLPLPPDVTPATTGAWTTVDVSAYTDASTTGVVLLLDHISGGSDSQYGVRETGASFSDTSRRLNANSNTMYYVGVDAGGQFDVYLSDSNVKVYLIGRTAESIVYYTDDLAVTDPSLGSWQDVDADTYAVPPAASGLILYGYNGRNNTVDFGVRKNGSTDDSDRRLPALSHLQGGVGLDADNIWEMYLDRSELDASIAAYTTAVLPTDVDVHIDMDVLVRRANGTLRATLGTNVANSPVLSASAWTTVTGTWTPAEYVIADPTDYLEFDLFAEFTRNDGDAGVVYVQIDDNTVDAASQTGMRDVGLNR